MVESKKRWRRLSGKHITLIEKPGKINGTVLHLLEKRINGSGKFGYRSFGRSVYCFSIWQSARFFVRCHRCRTKNPETSERSKSNFFFMQNICSIILIFSFFEQISFRSELKIELRFLLKSLLDPDRPKPVRFWKNRSRSLPSNGTNQSVK